MATILDLQALEARLEMRGGRSTVSCSDCGGGSEELQCDEEVQ